MESPIDNAVPLAILPPATSSQVPSTTEVITSPPQIPTTDAPMTTVSTSDKNAPLPH
ncbi:hypothetical protein Dimus_010863, partial [Dionaea muscipula]